MEEINHQRSNRGHHRIIIAACITETNAVEYAASMNASISYHSYIDCTCSSDEKEQVKDCRSRKLGNML